MKKIIISLIFMSFFSVASNAEIVTRQRTVVDTVAAMKMIKDKYDRINNPIKAKLNNIQSELASNSVLQEGINKILEEWSYINSIIIPKVKDQNLSNHITDHLKFHLSSIPDQDFLKFCKEKDVEKVKKKGGAAILELKNKVIEKTLKDGYKGNFSSGVAQGAINYMIESTKNQSDFLKQEERELKSRYNMEHKLLKVPPTFFIAKSWMTEMPDQEVPTKVMTERRERRGEDDMDLKEALYLVGRVDSDGRIDPGYREDAEYIEGRFDGLIKDRLYFYGVTKEDGHTYSHDLLISEKGTVPFLKVSMPGYGEESRSELLNAYWDYSGKKKDGVKVEKNTEGTSFTTRTCVFENGKWVSKRPIDINCMTFDECLARAKEIGIVPKKITGSFHIELYDEIKDYTFYLFTPKLLKLPYDDNVEGNRLYFIVNNNTNGYEESEGTMIKGTDFTLNDNIYVKSNYFGPKRDAIFVERFDPNGKNKDKILEIYAVDEDPGTVWEYEDATICDGVWICKVAEGTYNSTKTDWIITKDDSKWIIPQEY